MKERDTAILSVRIKKGLLAQVAQRVANKKVSRNSWIIWAVVQGLRSHRKKDGSNV